MGFAWGEPAQEMDEDMLHDLKQRFVTRAWNGGADGRGNGEEEDDDEEGETGGFEDMETGQVVGKGGGSGREEDDEESDSDAEGAFMFMLS